MAVNERHGIRLVVEREVREALRRKTVWITAALFLVASTAIVVVPALIGSTGDDYEVGVVGEPTATLERATDAAAKAQDFNIDLVESPDRSSARKP